ncbi:hypothetical protein C3L29_025625 [Pseudomonas sp. MWU12-2534b]|nr:hypothetical protein C3L29_025625 [Pseudomonas sp. MWU12-2534b]
MWRGSLLPLGRAAAVTPESAIFLEERGAAIGVAAPPSGSELPRHGKALRPFGWAAAVEL